MQLPGKVNLASLVGDADRWLSGWVSALPSVVAGSNSSGEDHGIHYWWDLIRSSKQLSSVSVCHVQVFAGFSAHDNLIYSIIPPPKKENVHLVYFISLSSAHIIFKPRNYNMQNNSQVVSYKQLLFQSFLSTLFSFSFQIIAWKKSSFWYI